MLNQGSYCCSLDEELLMLDCLGIDATLQYLLEEYAASDEITLINPQGKKLQCSVDLREKLLQARGLANFLGELKNSFFIKHIEDNTFQLSSDHTCQPVFPLQESTYSRIHFSRQDYNQVNMLVDGSQKETLDDYYLHREGLHFALAPGFDELLALNVVRNVEPYRYQTRTVQHVLQHMHGRALLCDEVGLGKTVEAGLILMEYLMRGLAKKILILTPPSLMEQWQEEMRSKFNLNFVAQDSRKFRQSDNGWLRFDRVIASIEKAKRQDTREDIWSVEYDLAIVDEAHHLKNRKTLAWQLVNRLKKRYILLLTATPVENELEELFNLITLLSPGQLDTAKKFRERFITRGDRLKPRNSASLRMLLKDVMIRNRRSETESIITRRSAETIEVELTASEKALYQEVTMLVRSYYRQQNRGANQFVLKTLQREVGSSSRAVAPTLKKLAANDDISLELRDVFRETARKAESITDNAKAVALVRLLRHTQDKVIIFTAFQQTRAFLMELLRREGFAVTTFHGSMRRAEKEQAINDFKTSAQVLVSTESGGEGRNLQFCNLMVNYDLPWNPMRIEQRIGRIHRVGQKRDVFIYNLVARDSIEAKILDLLDAKINMFQLVVGELDMILGNMKEKKDFEDILLDIWLEARDEIEFAQRLEHFGDQLTSAKSHYQNVKRIDEQLLAELMPDDK